MNVIVQIDTVQHHHAHDATSQQVLHLLSSYLKMAYHRNMGGAWKAARLRLAETSAIPGTAANNEGEPLTNGNADEAIGCIGQHRLTTTLMTNTWSITNVRTENTMHYCHARTDKLECNKNCFYMYFCLTVKSIVLFRLVMA